MRPRVLRPVVAALLALSAGCGGSAGTTDTPSAGRTPSVSPSVSASAPPSGAPEVSKVLTIVLENHGVAAAREQMPQLVALADRYGVATHVTALTHPSLPNYLALAGGSTFGVSDDAPPADHPLPGPTVFDTALAAGLSARTYAEAMPAPCALEDDGSYAVRHNPWAYFADPPVRAACQAHDLPAGTVDGGALHDDIAAGALPEVGLLVPDVCHDGHDCPLSTADGWVARWVAALQSGPDWAAGRLAVVVTFDEDEGDDSGGNDVLTVVATPRLSGDVVTVPLTHLSWSRWMSELAGASPLREAADAPSLGATFGL